MATLVSFHAHPDDEAILAGGLLAKAAAAGHRVVLVFATRGEHGEVRPGVLGTDELLSERRTKEALAAAKILGVAAVEFLGYEDSGMIGTPENSLPAAFCQADVDDAARRLAAILDREGADVLTIYDDHGGYGHPDHVQVHRVGVRATELNSVPGVFEATYNRDQVRRGSRLARLIGKEATYDPSFGTPRRAITDVVDVSKYVGKKRAAMVAHASQIGPESPFLALPRPIFAVAFRREWFIRRNCPSLQSFLEV